MGPEQMPGLEAAAEGLRGAMGAGLWDEAGAWAEKYCRAVAETIVAGGAEGLLARQTAGEALELLEWCRRVALADRAHCATRLASLRDPQPYWRESREHAWEIEG